MGVHEDKLIGLRRHVVSTRANDRKESRARFEKATEQLSEKCSCRVRVRTLYHGTTVENGTKIMATGFKVFKNVGAFGRGVNLSPDVKHTLAYLPPAGDACTLVCRVAIGKMHENTSRHVKGNPNTVPDFIKPKPGFDAMYGAGGMIVVVPSAARVLPVRMIVHIAS
jgi:hypothetical protein